MNLSTQKSLDNFVQLYKQFDKKKFIENLLLKIK